MSTCEATFLSGNVYFRTVHCWTVCPAVVAHRPAKTRALLSAAGGVVVVVDAVVLLLLPPGREEEEE